MIAKKITTEKKKRRAFINNCSPDHFQLMNVVTCEGNTEKFQRKSSMKIYHWEETRNYYLFSDSQKAFQGSETEHTVLFKAVKAILQKESCWSATEIKTRAGH